MGGISPSPYVQDFLNKNIHKVNLWGESAVPYLWAAALELEQYGQHAVAEGLLFQVLTVIVSVNGGKGKALPSPYYEPQHAIELANGLDPLNRETFNAHSYTAEVLTHFMARRLSRRSLTSIWEKVTRVRFTALRSRTRQEWFRWQTAHGSLATEIPGVPQSWHDLVARSTSLPQNVPALIKAMPQFALLFALVFPHRFNCELVKVVEFALGAGCA